ncbi:MAG TPA: hypothetical protein VKU44_12155 [Terriglobia bacterium]|nr:hypothetical protein [Terriglobia bacterium]
MAGLTGQDGGTSGAQFQNSIGVWGDTGVGFGVCGSSASGTGVAGFSNTGDGVGGYTNGQGAGIHGINAYGSGNAGLFEGTVQVTQVLTAGGIATNSVNKTGSCNFKIDHPLDPANKYLYHCSVESPDMKNIYDGVAVLDARGEATVRLPDWFGPLNDSFRYQLTAIGAPAPSLHVAEEIGGNRFKIAGGLPGMKVSWQVTGIRHDPYAEAHRSPIEVQKDEIERGYYLCPEVYGETREKSIEWVRSPWMHTTDQPRPPAL